LLNNAQKLVDTIRKGASFEDAARQYSQDHLASKGGDWGWVERTDMREELADIAFTLEKGKTSDPVIVDGYAFILQVSDKREAGYLPLPEVRTQIEEIISNQEAERVQNKMVEKLRKKAHIQYFLGKS
jgi:parvulin-like peptidyl-prolyl isomerase